MENENIINSIKINSKQIINKCVPRFREIIEITNQCQDDNERAVVYGTLMGILSDMLVATKAGKIAVLENIKFDLLTEMKNETRKFERY